MSPGGFVLALAALALSSGCAVGPDYKSPRLPPGAAAPFSSVRADLERATPPPDSWWRLYDDPRLDSFVQEAFAANTDLSSAEADLSAARAVLEEARGGRYPATTANFGGMRGRDATVDAILAGDGLKPRTVWKFDDVLDVSYELDLFGHERRSTEASRGDAQAASAARDVIRVEVAAETARAYAQICALGAQLAVAHRSLDVATEAATISTRRRRAGAGTELEVVDAQTLSAQVRASLAPLESQRHAALFELTALLGRAPAFAPTEAQSCVSPLELTALIPVGDGAALLARRPDVRQAERRLAAATARIGVATADLYPRISLIGLYGGADPSLSGLASERSLTWGLGPSVNWSFPDQTGPRAKVRQATANTRGALAAFDGAVLRALMETEQSLAAYSAELDHRQALEDADAQARRAFQIANAQLGAGAVSQLDLLFAEKTLVAADAAVADSDGALVQDQIGVFKALGGGWRMAAQ
jgi:multidrug efflux system outer membrane protein